MRPEVRSALAQLRGEIDILAASVVARSRLAAPEILTPQRVSVGSARAAVQALDPERPFLSLDPLVEPRDAIIPEAHGLVTSGRTKRGMLRHFIEFGRRMLRAVFG